MSLMDMETFKQRCARHKILTSIWCIVALALFHDALHAFSPGC
jgi:hypothetical protein